MTALSDPPKHRAKGLPELPVYESMKQAVAHTGIPIEEFKWAKDNGCDAFAGGSRIVMRIFLPWWVKNRLKRSDNGEVLPLAEEKALQIRQTRLDQEKEAKVRDGELCERVWVEKEITEKFILPFTAEFNDAPANLSVRCNPDNPQMAKEAIQGWCDNCKRKLREKLVLKESEK